jgi:ABC-type sulfate transport system permease component
MGATGIAVAVRTVISHAVKRILAGAVGCWHRNFGSLLRIG